MGAVADYATYESLLATPTNRVLISKQSTTINGSMRCFKSLWTTNPESGAAPSTAAVPTAATQGALRGFFNGGGGQLWLPRIEIASGNLFAPWLLIDRLSHQGGLSGTVTTAQTTNLPTAALTRYTSGVGVFAALEVYTQIGTTATTVTVQYTDQDGNTGLTSQPVAIGATGLRELGTFIPMNLASGDYGVREVANVDLLASTGTAGNFGVTLYKPLAWVVPNMGVDTWHDGLLSMGGNIPEIVDDSCLAWLTHSNTLLGGVSPLGASGYLDFIEA